MHCGMSLGDYAEYMDFGCHHENAPGYSVSEFIGSLVTSLRSDVYTELCSGR